MFDCIYMSQYAYLFTGQWTCWAIVNHPITNMVGNVLISPDHHQNLLSSVLCAITWFHNNRPNGCEVIPYFSFDLYFPNFS